MARKNFVDSHCHVQSLDSASTPENYAKREVELETGYLTVTDHGTLEACRRVYDLCHTDKRYQGKLNPILGCLMPGQEIHTIGGIKKVEDIQVGDLVLTHKGRYRPVTKLMSRTYDGDVYTFYQAKNGSRGITVTAEHPLYISGQDKRPKWMRADEIVSGKNSRKSGGMRYGYNSYMLLPKLKGECNRIDVRKHLETSGFIFSGQTVAAPSGYSWKFSKNLRLTEGLCRFLGLHCAEGWTKDDGQAGLTFNIKETEFINFCVTFLSETFGIEAAIHPRPERGSTDITYCHRPVSALLGSLCGVGAHNKKVPEEILTSRGARYRKAFLEGLLQGDGKKGDRNDLKLSSEGLVWSARLLALDFGIFSTPKAIDVELNGKKFRHHYICIQTDAKWRRSFGVNDKGGGGGGSYRAVPIRESVKSHYSGPVYNFSVEEDNSYVSDCILHNCEAYFRDDEDSILEAKGVQKNKAGTYVDHIKYCHITMHAIDEPAYLALVKAISKADLRAEQHGTERKPLFDWKALEELGSYNITMTSGCLIGMVGRHLMEHNDFDTATKYYEKLRGLVKPGNFFVEVMPHVCDTFWRSTTILTAEDGSREELAPWKTVMTKAGKAKIGDIAKEFGRNAERARKKHQAIMEVMENRKFVPRESPFLLKGVEVQEGLLKNECRPWAEDGDYQAPINRFVLDLAKKYGDVALVSSDSHFAYPEEKIVQDVRLGQNGGNWRLPNSHHRMSSDEAWTYFRDVMKVPESQFEEWVENTHAWASRFKDFRFTSRKTLPTRFYPEDTLRHTMALIEKRGRMDWKNPVKVDRLKEEINLLHKNGTIDLLTYFMIDQEVTELYARKGELTGPGRGSAAGVSLTYLLGITHADPIRYKLSLDRFMTLDRIASGKLPDLDQDLPHRNLLVDPNDPTKGWLAERFGDCCAQLSTDTTMKLKSSIKDVDRYLNRFVRPEVEDICGRLPDPPQGISDRDFVFGYTDSEGDIPGIVEYEPALQEYVKTYPKEWDIVQRCLGITRQRSRHPCGFLISNEPVDSFIPMTTIGGHRVTGYTAAAVEASGGLKMDFLVVNSLNDIGVALKLIQDRHAPELRKLPRDDEPIPFTQINGLKVYNVFCVPLLGGGFADIWDLPNDPAVYDDICSGKVETVFQLDAGAARQGLGNFRPTPGEPLPLRSIETLAAFTALDRPGPLDAFVESVEGDKHNMLVEFAKRSRGESGSGRLQILDDMLPETFGILVFQEQLQAVFQKVGGTTGIEANDFRQRIGKKKMAEVEKKDYPLFMKGAVPRLGEVEAQKLWSQIRTFGQYGFNISHAVCYMLITYACAWLKRNYPLEWWTSVLRNADRNEIDTKFWRYCGRLIKMPDIALSKENFAVEGDFIRAPLWLLKGVGEKAHQQLVAGAPYLDITDLVQRIESWKDTNTRQGQTKNKETGEMEAVTRRGVSALNDTLLKNLTICGILDSLYPDKDESGLEMTVTDQLRILATACAKVRKQKKVKAFSSDYAVESEVVRYQVRKKLLPAYAQSMRPLAMRLNPRKFTRVGRVYVDEDKDEYVYATGKGFQALYEQDILPPNLSKIATVAYVYEDRRWDYVKDGEERQGIELFLDIDGFRTSVVKFSGRSGLPPNLKENLEGAIVGCLFNRSRSGENPFYFVGAEILAPPLKKKTTDEESSPTEDSK
jgi:DNA polymerase III alpha subunit